MDTLNQDRVGKAGKTFYCKEKEGKAGVKCEHSVKLTRPPPTAMPGALGAQGLLGRACQFPALNPQG